ncbi:UbiA family prenyltransferase [Pelagibacterium sp. 26DY04]|uniref:UbiA family prenyltransferase n=1 Tax=Pelagibacterium sp. 26DY04 TaxID=2967130 RepID=UPI0028168132|nr:UbiA family prenyltransferase [Pelagibacterium sp. 26DY04]WMT85502.1 UbiA family prenyltransferase [Pelagibacterium sp. 26DY04]
MMTLGTALRLGRVSNLPTVATNAMAGSALTGAGIETDTLALVVVASVLAYIAGMFLNDAFDASYDTINQPYRPIPAGLASQAEVFAWGFGLLGASVVFFVLAGWVAGTGWPVSIAGLALALTIVTYNRSHKENAFGPILMGLCRLLVYLAAALAVVAVPGPTLWIGAALLMAHVMGLTYVAKSESGGFVGRWWPLACIAAAPVYGMMVGIGDVLVMPFALALLIADVFALRFIKGTNPSFGRAIPLLIATIPLLDGLLIAQMGRVDLALLACVGFPLTLWLQRWVRGT